MKKLLKKIQTKFTRQQETILQLRKEIRTLIDNPDSMEAMQITALHNMRKQTEECIFHGTRGRGIYEMIRQDANFQPTKLTNETLSKVVDDILPKNEEPKPGTIVNSETFADIVRDISIKRNVHGTIADHFLYLEKELNGKFIQNLKGTL